MQELLAELAGMLAISCEAIADALPEKAAADADIKRAFRAAGRAVGSALRLQRRIQDLQQAAPPLDATELDSGTCRSACRVSLLSEGIVLI